MMLRAGRYVGSGRDNWEILEQAVAAHMMAAMPKKIVLRRRKLMWEGILLYMECG